MDSKKRKRLENAGWAVGDASDFLGLNPAEAELVELKVNLALEEIFTDMKQVRESLSFQGESLSQTVIKARQEERY